MRIAIASDEISFDFETAVSLGLEWGVECFELKRLNRKRIPDVDDADLVVVGDVVKRTGATLTSLSPGLFKDPLTSEAVVREMDRFERTIALAHRFEVSRVVVFGFERDGSSDPETMLERTVEVLGRASERAKREGVTLLLENEPAFWVDCPDTAVRVIRDVGIPELQINWDPCNALGCACGAPYPQGYELVRPHVGHVHVKDAHLSEDGSVEYVQIGTGDMDWVGQFGALMDDGYDGYCVLEPHFGNRVASSRAAVMGVRTLVQAARQRVASK